MSRKQRRGFGPPGAKPALGSAAGAANSPAALFNAAVAHHQTGALIEAERQYRHILTLMPNHADSLHNLGLIALQRGDAAAAVELFGMAVKINGTVAEYHYNAALAWRALNRSDHVATHLERAIALRSDYALAHLNLGNVRREQGRLADAAACYERAIAVSPNLAVARFNLGNVLSEQGRPDAAVAQYNQVLAIDPNHAETHGNLGAALIALGRPVDAMFHLERAAALKPDLFEVFDNLAQAYLASGDVRSAILAAGRALELKDTAAGKIFFAQCLRYGRFTADNGQFRRLALRALSEGWTHPRELVTVCLSLIALNGAIVECIARANKRGPHVLPRRHYSVHRGSTRWRKTRCCAASWKVRRSPTSALNVFWPIFVMPCWQRRDGRRIRRRFARLLLRRGPAVFRERLRLLAGRRRSRSSAAPARVSRTGARIGSSHARRCGRSWSAPIFRCTRSPMRERCSSGPGRNR